MVVSSGIAPPPFRPPAAGAGWGAPVGSTPPAARSGRGRSRRPCTRGQSPRIGEAGQDRPRGVILVNAWLLQRERRRALDQALVVLNPLRLVEGDGGDQAPRLAV